jgi:hypothetical protein
LRSFFKCEKLYFALLWKEKISKLMQGKEKNNVQEGRSFSKENYSLKLKFYNHLRNKMRCTLIVKLIFKYRIIWLHFDREVFKE